MSDFGGQLGLWIDVSVISVIEFLIFIVKIMAMGSATFQRTVRNLRGI